MKTPQLHIEEIFLQERENTGIAESVLEDIQKSNKEILSKYMPSNMKIACEKKLLNKNKKAIPFPSYKNIGLVAAACITIVLALGLLQTFPLTDNLGKNGILASSERAKGSGARLFAYKKEVKGATVLRSFSKVSSGDIIQLSYLSTGQEYGAIFSIDGNGIITRHFPDDANMADTLKTGGEIPLAFAYKLDDAPSYERFILITSPRNFSVTSIINSIQQAGRFALGATSDLSGYLPSGAVMTDILLLK